jgi:hypothetical protein
MVQGSLLSGAAGARSGLEHDGAGNRPRGGPRCDCPDRHDSKLFLMMEGDGIVGTVFYLVLSTGYSSP